MMNLVASATAAVDAVLTPIIASKKIAYGQMMVEVEVTGVNPVDFYVYYSFDETKWTDGNVLELQDVPAGQTRLAALPLVKPGYFKVSGSGDGGASSVIVRVYQPNLRYTQ